jgi:hypothetical protein
LIEQLIFPFTVPQNFSTVSKLRGVNRPMKHVYFQFLDHFIHFPWIMARNKVMLENSIIVWKLLLRTWNNNSLYNTNIFFWIHDSFNGNEASRTCRGKTSPKPLFFWGAGGGSDLLSAENVQFLDVQLGFSLQRVFCIAGQINGFDQ